MEAPGGTERLGRAAVPLRKNSDSRFKSSFRFCLDYNLRSTSTLTLPKALSGLPLPRWARGGPRGIPQTFYLSSHLPFSLCLLLPFCPAPSSAIPPNPLSAFESWVAALVEDIAHTRFDSDTWHL